MLRERRIVDGADGDGAFVESAVIAVARVLIRPHFEAAGAAAVDLRCLRGIDVAVDVGGAGVAETGVGNGDIGAVGAVAVSEGLTGAVLVHVAGGGGVSLVVDYAGPRGGGDGAVGQVWIGVREVGWVVFFEAVGEFLRVGPAAEVPWVFERGEDGGEGCVGQTS